MKKVAIIGGSGFIGSFITAHFANQTEANVVSVDRIDPVMQGEIAKLRGTKEDAMPRVTFVRSNIDQGIGDDLKVQLEGVDLLVFAAMTDIDGNHPEPKLENNFFALLNVLKWTAAKAPEVQLILLSSSQASLNVSTLLGASAIGCEALVKAYAAGRGFPFTIARCANVIGEGQQEDALLPKMIAKAMKGERITVRKVEGFVPVRCWTHAINVADALLTIATIDQVKVAGETFDIVGERPTSDLDLARSVVFVLGSTSEIALSEENAGPGSRLNVSGFKMREKLEWKPPFMLSDALIRTIQLTAKGSNE